MQTAIPFFTFTFTANVAVHHHAESFPPGLAVRFGRLVPGVWTGLDWTRSSSLLKVDDLQRSLVRFKIQHCNGNCRNWSRSVSPVLAGILLLTLLNSRAKQPKSLPIGVFPGLKIYQNMLLRPKLCCGPCDSSPQLVSVHLTQHQCV